MINPFTYLAKAARNHFSQIRQASSMPNKNENKNKGAKTMSKSEYVEKCVSVANSFNEGTTDEKILIGISTIILIYLNRLNEKFDSTLIMKCSDASLAGWNEADRILKEIAETGKAWNEKDFDSLITSQYVKGVHKALSVDDFESIQLIRWTFNFGEQLRVKYHTYEDFVIAFTKGELYDTKIATLSEYTKEILNKQNRENTTITVNGEEDDPFRSTFNMAVETMGSPELQTYVKQEPKSIGMFFGGMVVSGISQGKVQIDDVHNINDSTKAILLGLFAILYERAANSDMKNICDEHPKEAYELFVLGLYCNQSLGEDAQLIPYDMNFNTLFEAANGNPAAQVMLFGDGLS